MTAGTLRAQLIILVLALAISYANARAEDRLTDPRSWDLGFTITGGFIDQSYGPDSRATVRMPAYMKNERYDSPMASYYPALRSDKLTDNPLIHGALFTHATVNARNAGLRLSCGLMLEHRGTSFGAYAMENVAVMPKFFMAVDTSFAIGEETFRASIGGGNYDDHELSEGLTVYNIDVQGYHIDLGWRHLKASIDHISDLGAGIDLNIDDEADYTLSLEDVSLGERLKLDASAGYVEYLGTGRAVSGLRENGMNFSGAIRWGDEIRLYTQVGVRGIDDPAFGGVKRCADLIGCAYRGKPMAKLDLRVTGEFRYYGRYFNEGRSEDGSCFLYRGYDGYGACMSWNTTGSQLYPLHLFYRPFSQWAAYADYEGRDVQSIAFRADASRELPGDFSLVCNLDFNYLEVSNESSFLYPFYNVGFGWSPVPGTTIALSHTNRAMNLDKHYPTLYLMERGVIMISAQSSIAF